MGQRQDSLSQTITIPTKVITFSLILKWLHLPLFQIYCGSSVIFVWQVQIDIGQFEVVVRVTIPSKK